MSDVEVAEAPATPVAKTPKKSPKGKSPKTKNTPTSTHPKYTEMVIEAVKELKEKKGSSRHAILKYIIAKYDMGEKNANARVKDALKREVESGRLKQFKGTGASGSFKLADDSAKPKKSPAKTTKKPVAKKPAKKSAEKKPTAAKKSPAKKVKAAKKSPAKKPTPKKAAEKSPAKKPTPKKAAKPKKPVAKKAKK